MSETLSNEAAAILKWIESSPYQGDSAFSLACALRNYKGYGMNHPNQEYESLIVPYIEELQAAGLIYRSPYRGYGTSWVAECFRVMNDDFDQFVSNGKARSVLRNLQINSVDELTKLSAYDLLRHRGCGKKTVGVIIDALAKRGLTLADPVLKTSRVRACPHCGKPI